MYLKMIIHHINEYLESSKNIDYRKVGYVLSLEKKLMLHLCIQSRDELLQIIKENKVVEFKDNPRKIIIVDQADNLVWKILQERSQTHPRSHHVYVHITDSCLYLKLNQAVDIARGNIVCSYQRQSYNYAKHFWTSMWTPLGAH